MADGTNPPFNWPSGPPYTTVETMEKQNADNVYITGGYIDGVTFGPNVQWSRAAIFPVRRVSVNTQFLTTDYCLAVNSATNTVAITLPRNPGTGDCYEVVDDGGAAANNNITVSTTDSTQINKQSAYVISINTQRVVFRFNGVQWNAA